MRNNVLSKIDKNVVSLIDGISSDCWQKLKTDSFLRIFLVNLYMVVLMILTFLSFLLMIVWLLDHLFRLETLTLDLSIALIKVKPWLIDVLSFGVNVFNMSLEILFAYTFVKLVLYLRDYWHIITVHHFYIYNGTVVCWCDENLKNLKYLQIAFKEYIFLWIEQKKSECTKSISPDVVPRIINLWYWAIWLTKGCKRSAYWILLVKILFA
jgi:hypothetical protein